MNKSGVQFIDFIARDYSKSFIISSWDFPFVSKTKKIPNTAFSNEIMPSVNIQMGRSNLSRKGGNITPSKNATTHSIEIVKARQVWRIWKQDSPSYKFIINNWDYTRNSAIVDELMVKRALGSRLIQQRFCNKFHKLKRQPLPTFFGKISVVIMYGMGHRPIELKKVIHAKQNGGSHRYSGWLIQNSE